MTEGNILVGARISKLLNELADDMKYADLPKKFVHPKEVTRNVLLFIGINPSGQPGYEKSIIEYPLELDAPEHPYFKKMHQIAEECKVPWTHLDLLNHVGTDQKLIYTFYAKPNGVEYIWRQLQLAEQIIRDSDPKVIVVSNALAGTFLGKDKAPMAAETKRNEWLNFDMKFNDELGTYVWEERTPIFFSGMLTGQRALDKGSLERLIWHIKKALKFREQRLSST